MNKIWITSLGTIVLAVSTTAAQTPSSPAQRAEESQNTQQNDQNRQHSRSQLQDKRGGDMNDLIAGCLLIGNDEEIKLAEFARERATNERVRQFAEMLISDHQQMVATLKQISPKSTHLSNSSRNQTGTDSDRNVASDQNDNQVARGQNENAKDATNQGRDVPHDVHISQDGKATTQSGDVHGQLLSMQQRAAETCLRLTTKELSRHEGVKFDMAFAGSQIGAHIGMLAKLEAAEPIAEGPLQATIQQATSKVQAHLEQARALCKELDHFAEEGGQLRSKVDQDTDRR